MKRYFFKSLLIGMTAAIAMSMTAYAYNWQCSDDVLKISDDDAQLLWDSGYHEQDGKTVDEIQALLADLSGSYVSAGASEVDVNGNPIDWDTNGSGGEEGAGLETSVDLMEGAEISEEEKESVAAVLEDIPVQETAEESGSLRIAFEPGKGWADYTVCVTLYDSNFKKQLLYLYPQNDYQLTKELPAGHYQIYKMEVPGDKNDDYPIVYDMPEFDITADGLVQITAKSSLRHVSPVETSPAETQGQLVEEAKKQNIVFSEIFIIISAVVIVAIILGAVMAIKNRRRYE